MQAGQLVAAVGEVASLLVWLQRQSGGKAITQICKSVEKYVEKSIENNLGKEEKLIENNPGKEGCTACGWSKEEKEGLEVALHRTQEQVWFGLVWF